MKTITFLIGLSIGSFYSLLQEVNKYDDLTQTEKELIDCRAQNAACNRLIDSYNDTLIQRGVVK